jgi:hypothetical protein
LPKRLAPERSAAGFCGQSCSVRVVSGFNASGTTGYDARLTETAARPASTAAPMNPFLIFAPIIQAPSVRTRALIFYA